ncbi:MAG: hypothetical protein ABJE95_29390 [Byssovorax sp.]
MLGIERPTLALSFISLLPLGCGGEVATGGAWTYFAGPRSSAAPLTAAWT